MEENNENFEKDKSRYDTYDYVKDAETIDTKYEPSTAAKVLLIVMAVYLNVIGAIIGIIVGAVYMGKRAQGYKSFGKTLLIVSVIFLAMDVLLWVTLASMAGQFISLFMF